MHKAFKTIFKVLILSSFLMLPACKFIDFILGPPCTNCYSGDGSYDDDFGNIGNDVGDSQQDEIEHRDNPPRYDERNDRNGRSDDVARDREREARERERRERPPTQVQAAAMTLMGKYTIRAESAEILARHLLLSRTGDTHSIEALGIKKSDINAMIRGENPSASMLLKMAEVLKMELSEVHHLIQQIKTDIASQN